MPLSPMSSPAAAGQDPKYNEAACNESSVHNLAAVVTAAFPKAGRKCSSCTSSQSTTSDESDNDGRSVSAGLVSDAKKTGEKPSLLAEQSSEVTEGLLAAEPSSEVDAKNKETGNSSGAERSWEKDGKTKVAEGSLAAQPSSEVDAKSRDTGDSLGSKPSSETDRKPHVTGGSLAAETSFEINAKSRETKESMATEQSSELDGRSDSTGDSLAAKQSSQVDVTKDNEVTSGEETSAKDDVCVLPMAAEFGARAKAKSKKSKGKGQGSTVGEDNRGSSAGSSKSSRNSGSSSSTSGIPRRAVAESKTKAPASGDGGIRALSRALASVQTQRSTSRRRRRSCSSSRRPRSRTRRGDKSHSPHVSRGGPLPGLRHRHHTVCWNGRNCARMDCWFRHPEGRIIDEADGRHGARGGTRKRQASVGVHSYTARRASLRSRSRVGRRRGRSQRRTSSSRSTRRTTPSAQRAQRYKSPQKCRRRRRRTTVRKPQSSSSSSSNSSKSSAAPVSPQQKQKQNQQSSGTTQCNADGNDDLDQVTTAETLEDNSFWNFVSHRISDDASPEDALRDFEEHLHSLKKNDLSRLQGSGLFFDLYHPESSMRSFDLRLRSAQSNAAAFLADLQKGGFDELQLRTPSGPGHVTGMTCQVSGHLQPPNFPLDPDVSSLLISGLPFESSAWDIYDALQDCDGFVTASWTRPTAALSRDVYARFATSDQARSAVATLTEEFASLFGSTRPAQKDESTARMSFVTPSPELSGMVLPPEMSNPERIRGDEAISALVVKRLDALMGVDTAVTNALLSHEGSTELKLDLQLMYLRRVHYFCFYAATWCMDEWDLRRVCGTVVLRQGLAAGSVADEEGSWSASHVRRLEEFLASADKARPQLLDEAQTDESMCIAKLSEESTLKISEGKFKCKLCAKLFRAPDFVSKHLKKSHAAVLDPVLQGCRQDKACAAYLADTQWPLALQKKMGPVAEETR
eukprot:TRINITY_DN3160_c0_g1_i2.p1 TRINITY_DN3160_c0_g1~~TRINITY_DN3160_c0_g1_i2.p1  ORF type:complete len:970 (-),score=161.98 TRINITY_DN3160_c0_g1_i2:598-3507(-)